jgi:hypothetical protein
MRLRDLARRRDLRFHLAIAFLLWSICPQFALYFHSHAQGPEGHSHAALSPAELELAEQAATAVTATGGTLSPDFGLSGESAPRRAADRSDAGLSAGAPEYHAHFQEEANAVGQGLPSFEAPRFAFPSDSPLESPASPAGALLGLSSARAPPVA